MLNAKKRTSQPKAEVSLDLMVGQSPLSLERRVLMMVTAENCDRMMSKWRMRKELSFLQLRQFHKHLH